MDKAKLRHLKAVMEDKKIALREEIASMETQALNMTQGDATGELSTYDNHPGDLGTETFERGKDIALRDNARNNLLEIEEAEKRMEAGTYGICAECGKEIGQDRLEAIPWTTVCVKCKTDQEKLPDSFRRPAEEFALNAPFSRTFFVNDTDYNGFDGEDSWQAVARYGTATNIAFVDDDVDGDSTPEVEEDRRNME